MSATAWWPSRSSVPMLLPCSASVPAAASIRVTSLSSHFGGPDKASGLAQRAGPRGRAFAGPTRRRERRAAPAAAAPHRDRGRDHRRAHLRDGRLVRVADGHLDTYGHLWGEAYPAHAHLRRFGPSLTPGSPAHLYAPRG